MATSDDIATGNQELAFVLMIEGYSKLLTNYVPTSAVTTAYAATSWSTVISGLHVPGTITERVPLFSQALEGPALSFVVSPDYYLSGAGAYESDTFGEDCHKTADSSGNETRLDANVTDPDAASVTVIDNSNFGASGTAYIGTETWTYSAKADVNTFTVAVDGDGHKRGLFAPFAASTESTDRFARVHKLTDLGAAKMRPSVTDYMRTWKGRLVRLMVHSVKGGVLATYANAYTAYAGVIEDIQDKGANTVIHCKSVIDYIGDKVVLREQFKGKAKEGIYVKSDLTFSLREVISDDDVDRWVDDKTISAGYYTAQEICDLLTEWMADEKGGADMEAQVSFSLVATPNGTRCKMRATDVSTAGSTYVKEILVCPRSIAWWLGFEDGPPSTDSDPVLDRVAIMLEYSSEGAMATTDAGKISGNYTPLRVMPFQRTTSGGAQLDLEDAEGSWVSMDPEFMPSEFATLDMADPGFLKTGDKAVWLVHHASDTNFQECQLHEGLQKLLGASEISPTLAYDAALTVDESGGLTVEQVVIIGGGVEEVIKRLMTSTGDSAYNGSYDVLDEQLGLAIPDTLLATKFDASLEALARSYAAATMTVVLDKPTVFRKILMSELSLRNAYLVHDDGELRFVGTTTPVTGDTDITLTTSNKGTSADTQDRDRSSATITGEMVRNKITVKFGRDLSDKYKHTRTIINAASRSDLGEERAITIPARNTYGDNAALSDQIEALMSHLGANVLGQFGHPVTLVKRSINATLFASAIPGLTASLTDDSIRDPETGTRGVTAWPTWIMEVSRDWSTGLGNITLLMMSHQGKGRFCIYSPSARIDPDTAANYNVNQTTFVTDANIFTNASGTPATDVAAIEANDYIKIIEESPSNPAAPSVFTEQVDSVGSNQFTTKGGISLTASTTYYVYSDDRSTAQSSQQSDCYLADSGDGAIQDSVPARLWCQYQLPALSAGAADLTERHRYPPDTEDDEGEPVSTFSHQSAVITANNLVNYRCAQQAPQVSGSLISQVGEWRYTSASDTVWKLLGIRPLYLGSAIVDLGDAYERFLEVAPLFKRAAGAGTVQIRLTLCKHRPTGSTLTDVTFIEPYQQTTFTTTSATLVWGTRAELKRIGNVFSGKAYLVIEGKADNTEVIALVGVGECWLSPMK